VLGQPDFIVNLRLLNLDVGTFVYSNQKQANRYRIDALDIEF